METLRSTATKATGHYGSRRGVGEKLYRELEVAAAQRTLRHADPKTTSEMYSYIETSENTENVTEVFADEKYQIYYF